MRDAPFVPVVFFAVPLVLFPAAFFVVARLAGALAEVRFFVRSRTCRDDPSERVSRYGCSSTSVESFWWPKVRGSKSAWARLRCWPTVPSVLQPSSPEVALTAFVRADSRLMPVSGSSSGVSGSASSSRSRACYWRSSR